MNRAWVVVAALCWVGCAHEKAPPGPDDLGEAGGDAASTPADTDGDRLSDNDEASRGTDPNDADSDDDGVVDGDEIFIGSDPLDPDSDDDGLTDGEEVKLGTDPSNPQDASCGTIEAEASLQKRPVDIVMMIDNSSSMQVEIAAVTANVSQNFADILAAASVDYRIILLSAHGTPGVDPPGCVDHAICVKSPLSDTSCAPVPAQPANTQRFYQYSVCIDSTDSFSKILSTYNTTDSLGLIPGGWSTVLREGAQRVFLEITDDTTNMTADAFQDALAALVPANFAPRVTPNYTWHSIMGIQAKTLANQPYDASEPAVGVKCSSAANPSTEYETLSRRTGGLRFPVCETASYDAVFNAIAQNVITGTQVQCSFPVPTPAAGQSFDLDTVFVQYRAGGTGAPQTLPRVGDLGACASGASFYVTGSTIELCPQACTTVQADAMPKLDVHIACKRTPVL